MKEGLPRGWVWTRIADVTKPVPSIAPEDHPEREFSYVDISAIDNAQFAITETKSLKGNDAPSRARRPIQPHDVLFSNVRTYLRNIALVPEDLQADLCSTGFTVLRPSDAVDPRYLFRYVLSDDYIDRVTPQQTGTHYPATSDRVVMAEKIALPPLAEQRRIVAKLEELLGKADVCRKRLAKIPVLLKRFRQSVLAAACSGRLTADWRESNGLSHGADWREAELSEICTSICDGDHQPPPKQASGIPFLTIGNISGGRLNFSETRFVSEGYFSQIKRARKPTRGDVLYTVVGATIGIPVLVDTERPFCFQRHIALLRASSETTPAFLRILMASPAVFREAWARVTGSAQQHSRSAISEVLQSMFRPSPNNTKSSGGSKPCSRSPTRSRRATPRRRGTSSGSRSPSSPRPSAASSSRRTHTTSPHRCCWRGSGQRDCLAPLAMTGEGGKSAGFRRSQDQDDEVSPVRR